MAKQQEPEPGPFDYLAEAVELINGVSDDERKSLLQKALRYSLGIDGNGTSKRVDPSDTDIKTALDVSNETRLNLTQLKEYRVVLTRVQAVAFLKSRDVSVTLSEFRAASTIKVHKARFGQNRLASPGTGHLYTYAELCILMDERVTLAI
ncbi:MAG: hypothetical protein AAFR75_02235 [Pseudomonadota bacterium]